MRFPTKLTCLSLIFFMLITTTIAQKKTVGIFIYEMAILMDYVPSYEIFRVAGMGSSFELFSVGPEKTVRIMGSVPDSIQVNYLLENAPKMDVLVVPGGNWPKIKGDDRIKNWLNKLSDNGTIIYSVCSGAYVLANARLLDNKHATSIRSQIEMLKKMAPKSIVHDDVPFVKDGNILTSAGAATSVDAALFLVGLLTGKNDADWIANSYLDYDHYDPSFDGKVN